MATAEKLKILDPTLQRVIAPENVAERPESLRGKTVGLLANNKRNAEPLLEAIYDVLAERFDLAGQYAVNKGDASTPASPKVLDDISAQVDVVLTANGD